MTHLYRALTLGLITAILATACAAQDTVRMPSPGGETIVPGPWRRAYDTIGYAPARRVGEVLYVSGVIGALAPGETQDRATLEAAAERAFEQLDVVLRASGVTFDDVAMINSFHVWGDLEPSQRMLHVEAMKAAMDRRWTGPRPAWTAVGTTGLLDPAGVMEIQLIVRALPFPVEHGCPGLDTCR